MPYKPRKHQLEGGLSYHLLNRANRRLEIFHDEDDYAFFKTLLLRYVVKNGLLIYHYCLMPNHYHLEAEMEEVEKLPSVMAGIDRGYTHYYHKKYKTAGFLWQGRFKSKPIQKNDYLLSCARYIENNPVRARLVERAEEYQHSSARYYVLGEEDVVMTGNPLYKEFGATTEKMRYNYGIFLADSIDAGEEAKEYGFYNFEQPLGDKNFTSRLCRKNGREYPRRQGRVRNKIFVPEVIISKEVE